MTSFVPSPNEAAAQSALRSFLLTILPAGIEVVEGLDNRVPPPEGPDYVVVTAMNRGRLEFNVEYYQDSSFMASASGNVLTVTQLLIGNVIVGNNLLGVGVTANTSITGQLSGEPGGDGTYSISPAQTLVQAKYAAGQANILTPTKIGFQVDVHGPNAADNAQTISALFHDDYAFQQFKTSGFGDVSPLYTDEPKQVPFITGEQQYELRWMVMAYVEANQVIVPPQDFMDQLAVITIGSDSTTLPKGGGEIVSILSEEDMTTITVNVTQAQLLTIATQPIIIVPAPGANKMIVILQAAGYYIPGTVAYTGPATPFLYYSGSPLAKATSDYFNFVGFNRSQIQTVRGPDDNENPSLFLNIPVVMSDSSNWAGGNGTVKISVTYVIADFS